MAQTQRDSGLMRRSLKHEVMAHHSCFSTVGWDLVPCFTSKDHQAVLCARLWGGARGFLHPGRGYTPSWPGKGPFPKNLGAAGWDSDT